MTGINDQKRELSLEHRILIQVRQVLAKVVRDITPPPGAPYPLPQSTIDEIRNCFALISARERELAATRKDPDMPVIGGRAATTRIVDLAPAKPGTDTDE